MSVHKYILMCSPQFEITACIKVVSRRSVDTFQLRLRATFTLALSAIK